ncbi:hypothetical protein PY84_12840, partial [Lacticaseibacillus rhamnosus]
AKRLKVNANQFKLVTSDIAWIISHNEAVFFHIFLPEIQASFKDLKQFLISAMTIRRLADDIIDLYQQVHAQK